MIHKLNNAVLFFTATEGSDFVFIGSFEVVFETDSMNGTEECAMVSIIDDQVLEGTHGFGVLIGNTSPDVNIDSSANSTEVSVDDNDGKHECRF